MASWLENAVGVVQHGIEIEREGNTFYSQAAQRSVDPRGKAMFQALAHDELIHLNILQGHLQSLQQTGAWKEHKGGDQPKDRSQDAPTLFPRSPQDVQKSVKAEAGDLDALRFGIGTENRSYEFYAGQAAKATDDNERALFKRLAAEEEGHRRLLQDTLDYLQDPETFYHMADKPIFEG